MPEVLGYRLIALLGEGGSAAVWEAERASDRQVAAVKVGRVATAHLRDRFEAEARALRAVGPPHTPALLKAGTLGNGTPYLAMELLKGRTLSGELRERAAAGPPPLSWIQACGGAVLAALEAVHGAGLVHRDLKPENIFVREAQERLVAALTDFGLAAGPGAADLTRAGVGVGTPRYVAPEQLEGDEGSDLRADFYSLGVVLYEMVTQSLPFEGDADAVKYGHLTLRPPLPSQRVSLPAALEELILRCLAKDPARRPASASEIAELLAGACDPRAIRLDPKPASQAAEKDARSIPVVLLRWDAGEGGASGKRKGDVLEVVRVVERERGFPIRLSGPAALFGFLPTGLEKPMEAALRAADALTRGGGRALVHLGDLAVRSGGSGPPRVHGRSVDEPERWAAKGRWRGVLLTSEAAAALPRARAAPARGMAGFFRVGPRDSEPEAASRVELVGRGEILALAARSFRRCVEEETAGMMTLLGEPGLGKSRLFREIGASLERLAPEARVVRVRVSERMRLEQGIERARRLLAERPTDPVALLVDDAHRASTHALELLEYAALGGESSRLFVAVFADPKLLTGRPAWGDRAGFHLRRDLTPLPPKEAAALAAELLRPAEYPPAATLARLAEWAGGNPAYLEQLAAALKREGYVRPRPSGESYYLALPDLEALTGAPVGAWLAARALEDLPEELADLARLCSALDKSFAVAEVDAIQTARAREMAETRMVAADVGLAELVRRGLLRRRDEDYELASSVLRDGIYRLLAKDERRRLHVFAARYWRARPGASETARLEALSRLARHAGASGSAAEAGEAYLALAHRERELHRHADAERLYRAALAHIDAGASGLRARAHLGRGQVLYRLDRVQDALTELGQARALADSLGDTRLRAEALLEESAALDWAVEFDASEQRIEEAASAVEHCGDPGLEARWLAGRGRTHWRRVRLAEAAADLARAADLAAAAKDHDGRVIALLLLPLVLVRRGDLEAAEARFEEVISLCEERGDRFHLSVAYGNRMILWSARERPDAAREDLRLAMHLARETGNPAVERAAVYNLAEDLHWSGEVKEALALAHRARLLHERFAIGEAPVDVLLLARIHAASGDDPDARERLEELGDHFTRGDAGDPSGRSLRRAVELYLGRSEAAGWDALLESAAGDLPGDELLEILYLRGRAGLACAEISEVRAALAAAARHLDGVPIWNRRFSELEQALDALQGAPRTE